MLFNLIASMRFSWLLAILEVSRLVSNVRAVAPTDSLMDAGQSQSVSRMANMLTIYRSCTNWISSKP